MTEGEDLETEVDMRVLVACEESQAVCIAFRELGHEAYSCDLQECSGGHPEWHITYDAVQASHGGELLTESWHTINIPKWDLMIAHPPCKYLAWSGERWMYSNPDRHKQRRDAFEFLLKLYNAPVERVCIENSLSYFLERNWKKPTQTVHPFHFGDPYRKSTSLWLRNLKPLIPTKIVDQREPAVHNMWPGKDRDKLRAKTYPGIARAMAEQWGGLVKETVKI